MEISGFAQNSYIVGMKPTLVKGTEAHIIVQVFDGASYDLVYYVIENGVQTAKDVIKLYKNQRYQAAFALFHREDFDASIANKYDVYQGYIVTSQHEGKVFGDFSGFVLPVHSKCLSRLSDEKLAEHK